MASRIRPQASRGRRRRTHTSVEILERRDNPATFAAPANDPSGLLDLIQGANEIGGINSIILQPGSQYDYGSPDNYWFGPNALPAITSNLTIIGNGATIARAGGSAANFRLFCVLGGPGYGNSSAGTLTLRNLTLTGGVAGGGKGRRPLVKVLDGRTGDQMANQFAFGRDFRGGVRVGVLGGPNGRANLLEGVGESGGTTVVVRDGRTLGKIRAFDAFGKRYRGGVYVAG
ncbi:hypothetical protein P12x_005526 [Tundrisphaera lichenicola]|uniref:hypothetical protein n=1 Tax=Tundrisphaera lichenicola TaxID=2029860 RepID=UPI003EBCA2D9